MKNLRIILCFILIFCLILCISGCSGSVNLSNDIANSKVEGKIPNEEFIASQMEVYTKLFKSMAENSKNKNLLVSPLSIQLALSMAANGADGETKLEMEELLGGEINELNKYLCGYVNTLPQGEKYKTDIANSVWIKNGLKVEKDFLQKSKDYYSAEVYACDFSGNTVKDINKWVKKHTDGMIEKIVENINAQTVMMLINSVLFEAEWDSIYYAENVDTATFKTYEGNEKQVDMMFSTESNYIKSETAKGFIKNYKDAKYGFAAILPNEGIDIYEYVDSLDANAISEILNYSENGIVQAGLPKFSFEYSLTMNDVLKNLGMPLAFDIDKADFGKMATSEQGNIYIGEVLHKTNIIVDTKGTKAAAVTKVNMDCGSSYVEPKTVILDRPFVFMIIDNSTKLPIFMGIVTDISK